MNFIKHFLLFLTIAVLLLGSISGCVDDETPSPVLNLSQTNLQFELSECVSADDETFEPAEIQIENVGDGELEQISYQVTYDGSTNDWLDINLNNKILTVIPKPEAVDDLPVGAYTATIEVAATNSVNSYEELHILFEVLTSTSGHIKIVFHIDNAPSSGVSVGWAYTLCYSLSPTIVTCLSADLVPIPNVKDGYVRWLHCQRIGEYDFDISVIGCSTRTSGSSFSLSSGETRQIDVYIDC